MASKYSSDFLRIMQERGFVHQCTDDKALDKQLGGERVAAYIGFDATAPSLHAGSLMQIMVLRHLQTHGIKPIVLVGGATTKIGDPSGKDEARKLLTDEDIATNMEGIKQVLAKYPDAKIVVEQTANWDRAQALNLMENWLASGQKIDAVIAQNDEMALGAQKAIEAAGKQNDIAVIGIDAIPDALKAVGDGKMVGTVFQDAKQQGATAVDLAVQLVQGKQVNHDNYIPFQLVTKENLAKFTQPAN